MILLLCDMKNICLASASINIWNLIKWKKNIHKYFSKGTKNSSITRGVKHRRDIITCLCPENTRRAAVLWSRGFIHHHQPALAIDSFSTASYCCCCWACMLCDGIKFFSESIVHSSCFSSCWINKTVFLQVPLLFVCVALTSNAQRQQSGLCWLTGSASRRQACPACNLSK